MAQSAIILADRQLPALTSLRFFAALAIVVHHARGLLVAESAIAGFPLDHGVSVFFVLSGFILTYVYRERPNVASVGRFWLARFARIRPIHVFTLALFIALFGGAPIAYYPEWFLANLALVQAWIPLKDYFFGYNPLSWSISTEVGFYVLFPLLIHRFRETWWWKLLASFAVLIALMAVCTAFAIPDFSPTETGVTTLGLLYINPLGRLFEFVLGMCAALLWIGARPRLGNNIVLWTMLEIAAVLVFLWSALVWSGSLMGWAQRGPLPVGQIWVAHSSSCFAAALLILVLASGTGLLGRLLSLRPFVFLGEISYAMYMLHLMGIIWLGRHPQLLEGIPFEWRFLLFLMALLTACAATFLLIEVPMRKLIRRRGRSRPAATPLPSSA